MMKSGTSARDYVAFLVKLANLESEEAAEQMTPLYIQKLLYFIQGWGIVELGGAAFKEPIQAWPNGPVVADVYHELKSLGSKHLQLDSCQGHELSPDEKEVARMVWDRYKQYSTTELVKMTHKELAWIDARGGIPPNAHCARSLDIDKIERSFRERVEQSERLFQAARSSIDRLCAANAGICSFED